MHSHSHPPTATEHGLYGDERRLQRDCAQCCALCCVAPPFDAEQGFGLDKPAHTPCPNIRGDFSCAIHRELMIRGFPGCVSFDCYGAGQRTTQQMFAGASWRDSPGLAARIFRVYSTLLALHEMQMLLFTAYRSTNNGIAKAKIVAAIERVELLCSYNLARFERVNVVPVKRETMALLESLRPWLPCGMSSSGGKG